MTENIMMMTGLREKPVRGMAEQPYHMTAILPKLFPNVNWRVGKSLLGYDNKPQTDIRPDFLSTELKLIIEIDGDGVNRVGGHFTSKTQAAEDIRRTQRFVEQGYRVISIPPYVQLDEFMIRHYFGIDYTEKLYPAASEHGFAHPSISLPSMFCYQGLVRFKRDLDTLPKPVCRKIIDTIKIRIAQFESEGFADEDARAKVLPPSLWYMLDEEI